MNEGRGLLMRPLTIHRWYPLVLSMLAGVGVGWSSSPVWALVVGGRVGSDMVTASALLAGFLATLPVLLFTIPDETTKSFLVDPFWGALIRTDFKAGIYGSLVSLAASVAFSAGSSDFSRLGTRVFFGVWCGSAVFMFLASIRVIDFCLGEIFAPHRVRTKPSVGRKFA